MSDAQQRNYLVERLEELGYIAMTPELLAEVMRAAYLTGRHAGVSAPMNSPEDNDKKARAYAIRQMQRADLPTHDIKFLKIRDADMDTLLTLRRRTGEDE